METTTTLPGAAGGAACGDDVAGTGHSAQRSRGAYPVNCAVGQERRGLADPPIGVDPRRRIGRRRRVDAADRVERILSIVVVPVVVAALVLVGQHQQVAGVGAALQTEQTAGQVLPVAAGCTAR